MKGKAAVGGAPLAGARGAKAPAAMAGARKGSKSAAAQVCEMDVRRMIETDAYFRAERRGFAAGAELADWLDAEAAVNQMLAAGGWNAD